MNTEKPVIKVQDVLELLKQGYTRLAKDDIGKGSIQEHYGLNGTQVKQLFMHSKLKQRKTIKPKDSFILIDEEEASVVESDLSEKEILEITAEAAEPMTIIEEAVIGTITAIVESEGKTIPTEDTIKSKGELVNITEEVKATLFS